MAARPGVTTRCRRPTRIYRTSRNRTPCSRSRPALVLPAIPTSSSSTCVASVVSLGAGLVDGQAGARGGQEENRTRSGERGGGVGKRLVDGGVPPERIVGTMYGEKGARGDTPAAGRRVTVRAAETRVAPADVTAEK